MGCGSGLFLSFLKDYSREVSGVDFSEKMIEIANDLIPDGNFFVSPANNLPFENIKFDKIIAYSVFHYFKNFKYTLKVLNELIRVCKPGGNILIGDIPSLKHYKKLNPLKKRIKGLIKIGIKNIQFLRQKKNTKGIHERFYIHKPANWQFYNLETLCKIIQSKSCSAKILKQEDNIQWNMKTNNYRFDILIEKLTEG